MNLATGQSIGRGNGGEGDSAMEYVLITKRNIDNLKCMVGMSNQILSGKRGMEVGATWLACHTQTDNPGSGHRVPGAAEGWYDMDKFKFGGQEIGLGVLADALGGAKDLYDYMNQKDPILFTGRN